VFNVEEERETGWNIPKISEVEFTRFRVLIHAQSGINLRSHKRPLLVARLARRLRHLDIHSFSEYYEKVSADASGRELRELINRITTNKTSFFREPHHFAFLRSHVLANTVAGGRRLHIWSAASSSGEEPYSIAITAREALGAVGARSVQILASDIDTEMLAQADSGTYELDSLSEFSLPRLRAHFMRGFGRFRGMAMVRPELRRLVEFERINLIDAVWPASGSFDVIFCRNVIIYFDQPTQRQIVERMAAALKPGGYFFSGHSESLHWARDLLVPVQPTVFRRASGGTT
jgi:chemotaxis protein methyltransferase CheR